MIKFCDLCRCDFSAESECETKCYQHRYCVIPRSVQGSVVTVKDHYNNENAYCTYHEPGLFSAHIHSHNPLKNPRDRCRFGLILKLGK